MKRHLLLTMLLLMSVALLTPNIYATTANQYPSENFTTTTTSSNLISEDHSKEIIQNTTISCLKQTETVSETVENQLETHPQYPSYDINSTSNNNQNTKNIQSAIAAAGDESSSNVHITTQEIIDAAGRVKTFIEGNGKLPKFVQIGTTQVTMPEFLQLLTTDLLQIKNNNKTSITLKGASEPANPTESVQTGNILKTEYLELAIKIKSFMESTGKAPNYATSTLGKIRYESLIYMYSRILNYYGTNNNLPNYATIKSWQTTDTTIPDGLKQYLQPTLNCQSNDPSIISLANSLTAGKTSEYEKAVAIFNWVRDNIEYAFYYNTKKGAVETLESETGNCCDHSNLLVALARAAGLPARYEHGICTFSDGTFGHVWAQIYVDGTWYRADAISYKNTFGSINNWDTSEWTLIGIYAELPF